jgi:hypothetical protein
MRVSFSLKVFDVDLVCQWIQFFDWKKWNWVEFDFVRLKFEVDRHMGDSEVELYVLGLGIRVYWVSNTERFKKQIKKYSKMIKKFKKED